MAITYEQFLASCPHARSEDGANVIIEDDGEIEMRAIVLIFPDYVVVAGTYHDDASLRITDLDLEGACLIRVAMAPDAQVYTDHEWEMMERMREADDRLLSYAR